MTETNKKSVPLKLETWMGEYPDANYELENLINKLPLAVPLGYLFPKLQPWILDKEGIREMTDEEYGRALLSEEIKSNISRRKIAKYLNG